MQLWMRLICIREVISHIGNNPHIQTNWSVALGLVVLNAGIVT